MIDFSGARIGALIVHYIGNKANGEEVQLSNDVTSVADERFHAKLLDFVSKPFAKREDVYRFSHTNDLTENEVYSYALKVFGDEKAFEVQSRKMAKHLHASTMHPKITSGELLVVYMEGLVIDTFKTNGIALIKSDSKETIFKVVNKDSMLSLRAESGIGDNNIEKACLIVNSDWEDGLRLLVADPAKAVGDEAIYWREAFLQIKPIADNYHLTTSYLRLAKNFIAEKLSEDVAVAKTDQIDLLNKSIGYFKEAERFDEKEFVEAVFEDQAHSRMFMDYKQEVNSNEGRTMPDNFDIAYTAVKKQERIFKSVLKLDKNFHIYIHGDRDLIQRGVDDVTGMKYYKLFFKEES
jgi:hypothetical protein